MDSYISYLIIKCIKKNLQFFLNKETFLLESILKMLVTFVEEELLDQNVNTKDVREFSVKSNFVKGLFLLM